MKKQANKEQKTRVKQAIVAHLSTGNIAATFGREESTQADQTGKV